jgi:hypothetical protein
LIAPSFLLDYRVLPVVEHIASPKSMLCCLPTKGKASDSLFLDSARGLITQYYTDPETLERVKRDIPESVGSFFERNVLFGILFQQQGLIRIEDVLW